MERKGNVSRIRALTSEQLGQAFEHNGFPGLSSEILQNKLTGADIFDKDTDKWKTTINISPFKIYPFISFLTQVKEQPEFFLLPDFTHNMQPHILQKKNVVLNKSIVEEFNKLEKLVTKPDFQNKGDLTSKPTVDWKGKPNRIDFNKISGQNIRPPNKNLENKNKNIEVQNRTPSPSISKPIIPSKNIKNVHQNTIAGKYKTFEPEKNNLEIPVKNNEDLNFNIQNLRPVNNSNDSKKRSSDEFTKLEGQNRTSDENRNFKAQYRSSGQNSKITSDDNTQFEDQTKKTEQKNENIENHNRNSNENKKYEDENTEIRNSEDQSINFVDRNINSDQNSNRTSDEKSEAFSVLPRSYTPETTTQDAEAKPMIQSKTDTNLKPRVNRHLKPKPSRITTGNINYENINSRGEIDLTKIELGEAISDETPMNSMVLPPRPSVPPRPMGKTDIFPQAPVAPLPPKPPILQEKMFPREKTVEDSELREKFQKPPSVNIAQLPTHMIDILQPPPPPIRDINTTPSPISDQSKEPEEYLVPRATPSSIQNTPLPESPTNIILRLDRTAAENVLAKRPEGSFLYRLSTRDDIYCILALKTKEKVYNIPVIYQENNYYFETNKGKEDDSINRFRSLDLLTNFYYKNDLVIGEKRFKLLKK